MPACPTCGSTALPCSCEIANWLDAPLPPPSPTEPDPPCTACGYAGTMADLGPGKICPACGVVSPSRRNPTTLRVTHRFECPECGQQIGVTEDDRGKTVVCPGCTCFLGTPFPKSDH